MNAILRKTGFVIGSALGLLVLAFALLGNLGARDVAAVAPDQVHAESVDIRLDFVDLTYHGTETATLTLDVQARAWLTEPIHVQAFQDGFWLDEPFYTHFITATFTDRFFPASSYVVAEDTHWLSSTTTGQGIWFALIYQNYGGPETVITNTDWFTVVRTNIVFTQTQTFGNVTWTSLPPIFTVFDLSYDNLTGVEEPIPPELEHMPLAPTIVDTRLDFVDVTYHGTETGTLTLDVQARSWTSESFSVRAFQNGFWLDTQFYSNFITATFTEGFFPSSSYITAEDTHVVSATTFGGSGVWFVLIYQNHGGPAIVLDNTDWFTVVRTTIVFTQVQALGNVTWMDAPPVFAVFDLSGNQLQGSERPIPPELQNIPLAPPTVDTRLSFVDMTHHGTETGTLTIDMQARVRPSDTITIGAFQNAFWLDSAFHTRFITATFVDHLFSPTDYNVTKAIDVYTHPLVGEGVWFQFHYSASGEPASAIHGSDWVTVVRTTVVYTQAQATGNVTWTLLAPIFTVRDLDLNRVTGDEEPISPDLQNLPLSDMEYIYLPLVMSETG